jgi:hypothetical protein
MNFAMVTVVLVRNSLLAVWLELLVLVDILRYSAQTLTHRRHCRNSIVAGYRVLDSSFGERIVLVGRSHIGHADHFL